MPVQGHPPPCRLWTAERESGWNHRLGSAPCLLQTEKLELAVAGWPVWVNVFYEGQSFPTVQGD